MHPQSAPPRCVSTRPRDRWLCVLPRWRRNVNLNVHASPSLPLCRSRAMLAFFSLVASAMVSALSPLPLWVWSEYAVMPRYLQLHLLLFQHHAGRDFEVRTVNRSSLHHYVHLPPEFDRIPYAVAASDFARMALLGTHGGLYADLDFLVTRSLSQIRKLLDQYEIVSYISKDGSKDNPTPTTERECQQGFVSNFAAARNGSAFMMETWSVFRQQLTRRCGTRARHKICCYSSNNTPVPCRVPWAITDVLNPPIKKHFAASGRLSVYCFAGAQSFTPHSTSLQQSYKCTNLFHIKSLRLSEQPLEQPGDLDGTPSPPRGGGRGREGKLGLHAPLHASLAMPRHVEHSQQHRSLHELKLDRQYDGLPAIKLTDEELGCSSSDLRCSRVGVDLRCDRTGGRPAIAHAFYGRMAYHMFESIYGSMYAAIPRIEAAPTVFGSLYRIALQDVPLERLPPPFAMRQYVQLRSELKPRSGSDAGAGSSQRPSGGEIRSLIKESHV